MSFWPPTSHSFATWPTRRLIKPDSVHPYARGSLVLAVYHELGEKVQASRI